MLNVRIWKALGLNQTKLLVRIIPIEYRYCNQLLTFWKVHKVWAREICLFGGTPNTGRPICAHCGRTIPTQAAKGGFERKLMTTCDDNLDTQP
jgi:hypothetical protein